MDSGCGCARALVAPFLPRAAGRAVRAFRPDAARLPGSLVLPAASRLRQRSDFAAAARSGRRAARPRLVVHLLLADAAGAADSTRSSVPTALPTPVPTPLPTPVPTPLPTPGPPRAGFVVGRAVGGAVVRNRIRRQLRHLMASRLATLPAGARVVVRVLPAAATSTGPQLAADLDAALRR
jgi:ribonuclease P protein component